MKTLLKLGVVAFAAILFSSACSTTKTGESADSTMVDSNMVDTTMSDTISDTTKTDTIIDTINRQTVEHVQRPHPLGIPAGQIVVYGYQVNSFASQGI